MSAPRPVCILCIDLASLQKLCTSTLSSTALNHRPARSVWDEQSIFFYLSFGRVPITNVSPPHLYRNVANLCISSASIDLHECLQHSDQPSFFDASKLPFLKLIDDEVERHLRPNTQLVQHWARDHFLFCPREPAYALQYLQIQAPRFSSNAILNLSCRRIPFWYRYNRRWTPRQGQIRPEELAPRIQAPLALKSLTRTITIKGVGLHDHDPLRYSRLQILRNGALDEPLLFWTTYLWSCGLHFSAG